MPGDPARAGPAVRSAAGAPRARRVLVTGGAGYVGSHTVLALRDAGYPVTVVDDLSTGRREAVPRGAAFVRADVRDAGRMRAIMAGHGVGAIVHLAARVGIAESLAEPEACHRVNADATSGLVRAALDCGVGRFVFASSAAVYGEVLARPVREDAACAPVTPYGASKAAAEGALAGWARRGGLRYAALRLFNVAGADPALRAGPAPRRHPRLVDAACEAAAGLRAELGLFGTRFDTPDGTCVRDYVHVTDVAGALLAALRSLEAGGPGGVFNCGTGRGTSVREVLAEVAAQAGSALPARETAARPGDPPSLVADTARIRRVLGWSPRHEGLKAIVSTTLAWLRAREGRERERRAAS